MLYRCCVGRLMRTGAHPVCGLVWLMIRSRARSKHDACLLCKQQPTTHLVPLHHSGQVRSIRRQLLVRPVLVSRTQLQEITCWCLRSHQFAADTLLTYPPQPQPTPTPTQPHHSPNTTSLSTPNSSSSSPRQSNFDRMTSASASRSHRASEASASRSPYTLKCSCSQRRCSVARTLAPHWGERIWVKP